MTHTLTSGYTKELETSPAALADTYERIAALSEDVTRSASAYTGLVAAAPYVVPSAGLRKLQDDHAGLLRWQRISLELFAESVQGAGEPQIAAAFLDDLPEHIGWRHHSELLLAHIGTPMFFRTDQSHDGKTFEVQCPGSLWGVHEILRDYYASEGVVSAQQIEALSGRYFTTLAERLGTRPIVHHLLDNSSHPAGERYFIQRARCGASYFGFDSTVRPQDCNVVRAHDFPSLLNENFFSERLPRLHRGGLLYDLPPIAIFDQKLLLALPFWDVTRSYYDDTVRGLFPYTTVLLPQGLRLESGDWMQIEEFANLPRRQRDYFLKYAGADVARNWGSRAVYHLGKQSRDACVACLKSALKRFSAGERWVLQREHNSVGEVTYVSRGGQLETREAHSKHSTFHGPTGPLGTLSMFESFYKVHGSHETIAAIGVLPGAHSS